MEKKKILKLICWTLASPINLLSILIEKSPIDSIKSDVEHCLKSINQFGESVPDNFINALVLAEDHRNELHPGIDAISIIRAIWIRIFLNKIQGASTIEQQFVRTVTNRKEYSIYRKIREQLLALIITRRTTKRQIASAYLGIAFYGSGFVGISGINNHFNRNLNEVSFPDALTIIAQLKYPRPKIPNIQWNSKITKRINILNAKNSL
jgi:penicillin-binding protein 1A